MTDENVPKDIETALRTVVESPAPVLTKTCADCRHVMTDKRPRIEAETGFDDQLMFADDDETVYTCKSVESEHSDKEIGTVPVTCSSWAGAEKSAKSDRLAELDRLIEARERRTKDREE